MRNVREVPKTPAEQAPEGTWIQITFTLDPARYQILWERAEREHRTIPDLVHECVVGFLGEIKQASPKINITIKRNMEDPS